MTADDSKPAWQCTCGERPKDAHEHKRRCSHWENSEFQNGGMYDEPQPKPAADGAAPESGPKRLTKWEAGNELVALADACSRASKELKDWPHLKLAADHARRIVVKTWELEKLTEEMGFGI